MTTANPTNPILWTDHASTSKRRNWLARSAAAIAVTFILVALLVYIKFAGTEALMGEEEEAT